MMAILGFIGILVIAFVILGLIGWGVQALGFIVSFLGEGIKGASDASVNSFGSSLLHSS